MTIFKRIKRQLQLLPLGQRARRVLRERLTYLHPSKLQRIENGLRRIRQQRVPGDLIEFGVALGGSAIVIAEHAANGRRFFGLDVFEMIPAPTSLKDDDKSRARYETIKAGDSRGIGGEEYYGYRKNLFEEVKDSFRRHGMPVDGDRIHLARGLFQDTWPDLPVREVALVHVDCDWYDPVRFCLGAVADKMSPGGLIFIDDYHDYGGCRTAVEEFLASRPDFVMEPGLNPVLRKRIPS